MLMVDRFLKTTRNGWEITSLERTDELNCWNEVFMRCYNWIDDKGMMECFIDFALSLSMIYERPPRMNIWSRPSVFNSFSIYLTFWISDLMAQISFSSIIAKESVYHLIAIGRVLIRIAWDVIYLGVDFYRGLCRSAAAAMNEVAALTKLTEASNFFVVGNIR